MAVTNLQNFTAIGISSLNTYQQLREDPVTMQFITLQYQLNIMNLEKKKTYTLVHQIILSTKFSFSKILVLNLTKIIRVTGMVNGLIFKDKPLYMLYPLYEQYSDRNSD
jgi:hypothetical protein